MKAVKRLSVLVMLLGLVAIVIGGVFVGLGAARDAELKEAMRVEHVSLGIEGAEQTGQVIDSLSEAKTAGDTIREHRRGIASSYDDLLGEGRYDPTNPSHLSYAQALNLENYLYLAVVAFGLTQAVMGTGAFMLIVGLALGGTGFALYKVSKQLP
ncbi:hypothetical protein ACFLXF_01250 [Chloroflexota bacterium]